VKLAADSMLGRLSRWLRLCGFDTLYLAGGPRRPDADRVLITCRSEKQRSFLKGWADIVFITTPDYRDQLREVARALDLHSAELHPYTRCSVCNGLLRETSPAEIAGRVPEFVLASYDNFSVCPDCGRVYWPGTHQGRMAAVLDEIFKQGGADTDES